MSEDKLKFVKDQENNNQANNNQANNNQTNNNQANNNQAEEKNPSIIDGYVVLSKDKLPNNGKFYPPTWVFSIKPVSIGVGKLLANIDKNDRATMLLEIENLFKDHILIIDNETEKQIPSYEINDFERSEFMLILRNISFPKAEPILVPSICTNCGNMIKQPLVSDVIKYEDFNDDESYSFDYILDNFDGRLFTLYSDDNQLVKFRIPTMKTTRTLFNFAQNTVMSNHKGQSIPKPHMNAISDNKFMVIAPFLFITGDENINKIIDKYNEIKDNDLLFSAYCEISADVPLKTININSTCNKCSQEGTSDFRFPDGIHKALSIKRDSDKRRRKN